MISAFHHFVFSVLLTIALVWPIGINGILARWFPDKTKHGLFFWIGTIYIIYSLSAECIIVGRANDPLYSMWLLFIGVWALPLLILCWTTGVILAKRNQRFVELS